MKAKDREILTSKIAFAVVAGLTDEEILEQHSISKLQLKRIMNSRDFEILSKAYQQLSGLGTGDVSDTLSVKEALGNVVLGFLDKTKEKMRPRQSVIELLDTVLDNEIDSNVFLEQYESHHNVYWGIGNE